MATIPTYRPVDTDRLHRNLQLLAQFGALPSGGVDRQSYSATYRQAIDWLSGEMKEAGLKVREDPAGNLIGRIGPDGPALLCASHIDSVPRGGTLDGTLGVLAGLECARNLRHLEGDLSLGFEVIAFADEEGSFVSLLGSRAMTGAVTQEEIDRARSRRGQDLLTALTEYGLGPMSVTKARRPLSDFAGYIELHIEQGPVLEAAGFALGIVEAVAGISTGHHELIGQANHSGTTPLNMRRDALRAGAAAITRSFEALTGGRFPGTVLNFGRLTIEPGATNVVPKRLVLTQEIRSARRERILDFQEECSAIFAQFARELGVEHVWRQGDMDPPALMAEEVRLRIAEACHRLGIEAMAMPSGAGHDAQLFADICPTGMIFVPSHAGISHNPAEFTAPEHLSLGLQVLYATCLSWLVPDRPCR